MAKVPQLAFVACFIKYEEVTLRLCGQHYALQLALKLGRGGGTQVEHTFIEVKAIQGYLNSSTRGQ